MDFPALLPHVVPLEYSTSEGETASWEDLIADPTLPNPIESIFQQEVSHLLTQILDSRLSPREAQVIRLRFGFETETGENATLVEAAEVVGISRERIRQLENTALSKLRGKPQIFRALKSLL